MYTTNSQTGKNRQYGSAPIESERLARTITWQGSKQTYRVARLIVDKDLMADFFRAYGYFRWADDVVDANSNSTKEKQFFVKRQALLIDDLYKQEPRPFGLVPEEEILADLIARDRNNQSGLQSFIRNMFAVIEFDAFRRGRLISNRELNWYTQTLAKSVTDGIFYFVGHGLDFAVSSFRYDAAMGAHITHLLRDMLKDIQDGLVNIPSEYIRTHNISPSRIDQYTIQDWVESRVLTARAHFLNAKTYFKTLRPARRKIAGKWYCAPFEEILRTIEDDNYVLRRDYGRKMSLKNTLSTSLECLLVVMERFVFSPTLPDSKR